MVTAEARARHGRLELTQRRLLNAAVLLSATVLVTFSNDAAMLGKAVATMWIAVAIVVVAALRMLLVGEAQVVRHPIVIALGAFSAALLLSTVLRGGVTAFFGEYGRQAGALGYLVFVVVLLATVVYHRMATLSSLALAITGAIGLTGAYGVLQITGNDPVAWDNPEFIGKVLGTFGNPDFAGAYLAIGLPVAIWGAMRREWDAIIRGFCAVCAVLAAIGIAGSQELQGLFAGAAGIAVYGLALLLRQGGAVRRVGSRVWIAGAALATVLLTLDVAGFGPLTFLSGQSTVQSRRLLWQTAWNQFTDSPILGQGLDSYGDHYNLLRPIDETLRRDLTNASDAAHDVILNLFAGGGLLVGLAYLAVLGVVGYALVVGLSEAEGDDLLVLGAFGGAWVAYQAQALVSIDVVPLRLLHAVVSGAVIVAGLPPERRTIPLPALKRVAGKLAVAVPTAVVAVVLVVVGGRMVIADAVVADGRRKIVANDIVNGARQLERGSSLVPWEETYPRLQGIALIQIGQSGFAEQGVEALDEALRRNPNDLSASITAARTVVALGRPEEAIAYYALARTTDPKDPDLGAEAGLAALVVGDEALAEVYFLEVVEVARQAPDVQEVYRKTALNRVIGALEAIVEGAPDDARWLVALGTAQLERGLTDAAVESADAAAEIDPDADGLAELRSRLS